MKREKEKSDQNAVAELTREGLYKENKWLWEENKKLKDKIATLKMYLSKEENVYCLTKENRDLVEKIEKLLWEKIKIEEEIRSLELENRAMKVESEELKMWLIEKLPLALLKKYMNKFEGVDLKNV